MKYLFILGRNPLLSKAEIAAYLEREGTRMIGWKMRVNALLIDVDRELNLKDMINELGGAVAAGKVILSGNADSVVGEIEKKPIYSGRENKVVYSVLDYANEETFSSVLDAMKLNFREERLKARYKGVSGTIKLQSGKVVHGSPEKILLRDMNYFVFEDEPSGEIAFGCLEASCDSSETEKRDMEKPFRRESLAISPRIARILINLSGTKKGGMLADPFCGIGVILGEAMIKGINVFGVDIDNSAVNDARKNANWFKTNYKTDAGFKIMNGDSREIKFEGVDGIATEPSLGELMTKIPSKGRAEQVVSGFEELIIGVLKNARSGMKKGGRIAFTSPLIKTQGGRVSADIGKICRETGLRALELQGLDVKFPIQEYREDSIVGRDIFVLVA